MSGWRNLKSFSQCTAGLEIQKRAICRQAKDLRYTPNDTSNNKEMIYTIDIY